MLYAIPPCSTLLHDGVECTCSNGRYRKRDKHRRYDMWERSKEKASMPRTHCMMHVSYTVNKIIVLRINLRAHTSAILYRQDFENGVLPRRISFCFILSGKHQADIKPCTSHDRVEAKRPSVMKHKQCAVGLAFGSVVF